MIFNIAIHNYIIYDILYYMIYDMYMYYYFFSQIFQFYELSWLFCFKKFSILPPPPSRTKELRSTPRRLSSTSADTQSPGSMLLPKAASSRP